MMHARDGPQTGAAQVGLFESDAGFGEGIHVQRAEIRITGTTQRAIGLLVGE